MVARPLSVFLPVFLPLSALADDVVQHVRFREDVAPILVRKCLGCHNDRKAEGGLNLKTIALLKKGGKTLPGEAVVAGDPDASYLVELVRPDAEPRMPFKLPPLDEDEIRTLERWIAEGAKLDDGITDETLLITLVDPLSDLPTVAVKVPASDPVAAVTFSPDGRTLAAGHGKTVRFYDVSTGCETATLGEHPGPVTALRFTPDGQALAAVGGRPGMFGSLVVWDIATKSKRHDLRGHADAILAAALAPDGRTLATASYDRLVILWDVLDGKPLRTLKEHTDSVHGLAFSPDGLRLATVSADRTIKVWDVAAGRRLVTLSDATAEQYAVRYAPDGNTIFGAGVDRTIRAWRVAGETAELFRSAIAHEGPVLRMIVGPDGQSLYSCGEDRAIKVWDVATLSPRAALPTQADWPLDLALPADGSRLAVGRYDGSIALLDPKTGEELAVLREAPTAPRDASVVAARADETPPKPELVRPASLNPPSPRGAVRGSTVRVTLTGNGVGRADLVRFAEPTITASIVPAEKPDPNKLEVDLTIAPEARVGIHSFLVRTPLGTPAPQKLAVSAYAETTLAEPDDDATGAKLVSLPATILGTIDKPGDVDHLTFEAQAGRTLVFETLARPLGSGLDGTLSILDASGKLLASAEDSDTGLDPLLIFTPPTTGTYLLRVTDAEYGGSGNHFYRIAAGEMPRVASVFPLGVERGKSSRVELAGVNLGADASATVDVPATSSLGSMRNVALATPDGRRSFNSRPVVVADGPQSVEAEGNDEPARANVVAAPGGVSGRIDRPGDIDHFRFPARKGQRLILEVFGRRLHSPIDPGIDIFDASGSPLPRAVLRPVSETFLTFRDHNSTGRTFRLTTWSDFAIGDTVLLGRELLRVVEMPRNPDDEIVVEGLGLGRINSGERIGMLETTPEHHPSGQPFAKVEIHPPGASFPPGGTTPVTLYYRNDDGGPGFGKDARLTFDPPADGTYLVRVEDVRGLGGDGAGYHLVVREPRPDFQLSLSTDYPSVPRGASTVVTAGIRRIDGFDSPVDVTIEGLPPGITASPTRIERGQYAADLVLSAAEDAPAFSPPTWTVRGVAVPGSDSSETPIEHILDPAGPEGGWITVTPAPNLKVTPSTDRVVLRPGERVELSFTVARAPAFDGRVPIDVRNLPVGVRVENIGLNGVLVTEKQTERSVSLYAEPWVEPTERPFFAVGKCEAAGTEHSSPPIVLEIAPK
jgi:hypothetical protein